MSADARGIGRWPRVGDADDARRIGQLDIQDSQHPGADLVICLVRRGQRDVIAVQQRPSNMARSLVSIAGTGGTRPSSLNNRSSSSRFTMLLFGNIQSRRQAEANV
ncbi:hypothetical protein [Pseudoduganella umbonata]|uniref:Uncharacterized protein n=1 Tax=Pseudoduganella umbonata TaxID=864828 RepID=A0A4P8HL79_9BURK|nr:hypothetical protein [Pseudoduganella umbonata]MBB3221279.1 hypothetical protein [Pseudoduganella umbonata]QCP10453.1 hypothetical protein FCL38_08445 [Pseudoduganella umbonata]